MKLLTAPTLNTPHILSQSLDIWWHTSRASSRTMEHCSFSQKLSSVILASGMDRSCGSFGKVPPIGSFSQFSPADSWMTSSSLCGNILCCNCIQMFPLWTSTKLNKPLILSRVKKKSKTQHLLERYVETNEIIRVLKERLQKYFGS